MSKVYVSLDVVAHMFALQQIREHKHRERHYSDDPETKNKVRLEVSSALANCFGKILSVAEMSNVISIYERDRISKQTYSAEEAMKAGHMAHHILKEE